MPVIEAFTTVNAAPDTVQPVLSGQAAGQTFIITSAATISSFDINAYRSGAAAMSNFIFALCPLVTNVVSGQPAATAAYDRPVYDVSTLGTVADVWFTVNLTSNVALTTGYYAIVAHCTAVGITSVGIRLLWRQRSLSNAYANGANWYQNAAAGNDPTVSNLTPGVTNDHYFALYGTLGVVGGGGGRMMAALPLNWGGGWGW